MKRLVTTAAAIFFLAAMTSPSLAHKTKRKHSHKKPVATQPAENIEAGKTTGKTMVPQPPVESQTQKTVPPTSTSTGAPTEAKPAIAPAPSQLNRTDKMTDKATDGAKDKVTDTTVGTAQHAIKSSTPTAAVPAKVEPPAVGQPPTAPGIRSR